MIARLDWSGTEAWQPMAWLLLGTLVAGVFICWLVYRLRRQVREGGTASVDSAFSMDQLRRLHASGDLTDAEFEAAKQGIVRQIHRADRRRQLMAQGLDAVTIRQMLDEEFGQVKPLASAASEGDDGVSASSDTSSSSAEDHEDSSSGDSASEQADDQSFDD